MSEVQIKVYENELAHIKCFRISASNYLTTTNPSGYIMKPVIFQPVFAVFLFSLAVVGFYHVVFPVVVLLSVRYLTVAHKTYWLIEVH